MSYLVVAGKLELPALNQQEAIRLAWSQVGIVDIYKRVDGRWLLLLRRGEK